MPYANGIQRNIKYDIKYPDIVDNGLSNNFILELYREDAFGYLFAVDCNLDYICNIATPNKCGEGSNTISGFSSFKFYEIFDGNTNFLNTETVSIYNYRVFGTITSEVLSSFVFHYMIDFGTRERIVGV